MWIVIYVVWLLQLDSVPKHSTASVFVSTTARPPPHYRSNKQHLIIELHIQPHLSLLKLTLTKAKKKHFDGAKQHLLAHSLSTFTQFKYLSTMMTNYPKYALVQYASKELLQNLCNAIIAFLHSQKQPFSDVFQNRCS